MPVIAHGAVGLALASRIRHAVGRNREFIAALGFFATMMLAFITAAPRVFLDPAAYTAVFISLPILTVLAVSLVFVIAAGEIDLAFPSIVGLTALVFAVAVDAGFSPWAAVLLMLLVGVAAGVLNGVLVVYVGLSSLVATLGMLFLLRGVIQIVTSGIGIPLDELRGTQFVDVFVGELAGIPAQMFWGLGFALVALVVFTRHRFGAHVRITGDNIQAAREMGIDVRRVKVLAFAYVGLASSLAGLFAVLINTNFWPTLGEGTLLTGLAAVFVGGTPTWGGIGSVAGAIVGSFTVGFIETGIVAAGLTGFYTQFVYGLVIVISLVGHRLWRSSVARRRAA
jgi:simple sugar transport system permease protein